MRVIAFDIETVPDYMGVNLKDYFYLKNRGQRERTEEEVERDISFNPFTLYIISLAMVFIEDDEIKKGYVLYASDRDGNEEDVEFPWGDEQVLEVKFISFGGNAVEDRLYDVEERILNSFWKVIRSGIDRLVSFNGHEFDGHVIKVRSMIHGIKPTTDILDDFWDGHVDLLKKLSGGDRGKRFTLEFICRKFGISTPKDRIDGGKVAEEFFKGNYRLIAEYNLKDSLALAQLYLRIRDFINPPPHKPPTDTQIKAISAILSRLVGEDFESVEKAVIDSIKRSGEASAVIKLLKEIEKLKSPI